MREPRPQPEQTARARRVREAKIRASLLLKAVQSGEPGNAALAAARFQKLPRFADSSIEAILATRERLQRKHALDVVAQEMGARDWIAFAAGDTARNASTPFDWLFERPSGVFPNIWCKTYSEAAGIRRETGDFLIPYRAQFVVCPPALLEAHGIDPFAEDWGRIGRDCARPADAVAFARLSELVARAQQSAAG
jgi:hypothetical protein